MDVVDEAKTKDAETVEVVEAESSIHEDLKDLSGFKIEKLLFNNSNRKTVCLQGTFDGYGTEPGIVLLEKPAFEEQQLRKDNFFSDQSCLKKQFHNDIYGNYVCLPKVELNTLKATIIHPATKKHIEKYSIQTAYIIDETAELYRSVIHSYILDGQFDLQWVFNILEHKAESERIAFEDPDPDNGFILLPDLKWDGKTLETLYLLAIVHRRDLKCLRDLTGDHLAVLRNIRDKGCKAIEEKYGLNSSQLRIYVHYLPSFYHFHVHFTYLQYEAPGIHAERAHLLSNIIGNLTSMPSYYSEQAVIPLVVRESDKLFKILVEKKLMKAIDKTKPLTAVDEKKSDHVEEVKE